MRIMCSVFQWVRRLSFSFKDSLCALKALTFYEPTNAINSAIYLLEVCIICKINLHRMHRLSNRLSSHTI